MPTAHESRESEIYTKMHCSIRKNTNSRTRVRKKKQPLQKQTYKLRQNEIIYRIGRKMINMERIDKVSTIEKIWKAFK